MLGTTESLEARRQTLHTFFMSINSLFLAAIGLLAKESLDNSAVAVGVIVLAIAGCLLSESWRRQVISYGNVAASKWTVINAFESCSPTRPFCAEWQAFKRRQYRSFTRNERAIPVAFVALYGLGIAVASCCSRASASVAPMDFALTDEQQLIRETARALHRQRDRPAREGERPQPPLRHRAGAQDRRPGLPRRDRPARVRRRRPRLLDLRAHRRGGRARRLGDAHGRLGADVARVQRRSSAGAPRSRSSSTCPKLCTGEWLGCFGLTEPDTGSDAANQRRRARARSTAAGSSTARRCGSRWATTRRSRWSSPRPTRSSSTAASPASSSTPTSPASSRQEIHGKMGLHGSDTASISLDDVEVPTTRCSARSATASRSR